MPTSSACRNGSASSLPRADALAAATVVLAILVGVLAAPAPAMAQAVREVFKRVSPSVVVIRAQGQEVTETGSRVLVSSDGSVMTAAHVVHAMNEITVEFMGGDRARRASSPPSLAPTYYCLSWSPAGPCSTSPTR